mgnify:CR=1 FL=1
MRVAALNLYPLKGARAVGADRVSVQPRGFMGDRRWMVVTPDGLFATQRSHPRLATVTAIPFGAGLKLSAPDAGDVVVPRPTSGERRDVTVWDSRVSAAVADPSAHAWLSDYFGEPLMLVHMDALADRRKDGIWVEAPIPVSFADAYPVLVATTGSLGAINAEIVRHGGAAVTMTRFRPNVVIDCDEAWREDFWKVLRIGSAELELVKPCDRCIVTTTDQATGERRGQEPLISLARLRMSGDRRINGVLFGWNSAPRVLGSVAVGDRVEVLEERPEGFPIRRPGLSLSNTGS